jgi:hypothetical protein
MKLLRILVIASIALTIHCAQADQVTTALPIKKVIIWGHKLDTNTFSYINWAFHRAFKHLGYDAYWFDNNDDVSNFDFSNSLFITEGQVDQKIPLRKDCFYILHNCCGDKYKQLKDVGHTIILQVYTHDCIERNVTWLGNCMCYDMTSGVIYLPWATDLLPHEIEQNKQNTRTSRKKNEVVYAGTMCGGEFGNINQINPFRKAAAENNISFNHVRECSCSMETNIDLVENAYMAPAIQGEWQVRKGYIPCRIFKNISYGAFGITNSKTVYDLFQGKIVYNPDEYQLFYDVKEKLDNLDINELYELMDFVKEKHTYINRIHDLFWFFEKVYESKNTVAA